MLLDWLYVENVIVDVLVHKYKFDFQNYKKVRKVISYKDIVKTMEKKSNQIKFLKVDI